MWRLTNPRKLNREVPTPEPDGTNCVFQTTQQFKPHTLAVFQNGLAMNPINALTGFNELGDQAFVMFRPPDLYDKLEVTYEVA